MHIKKFEARDLSDALARIREELGPEAVILETAPRPKPGRGVTVLAALPREDGAVPAGPRASGVEAATRALMRRPLPARLETADESFPWPARGAVSEPERPAPAADVRSLDADLEDEARGLRARVAHLSRVVRSDHFSSVPLPLRQLYFDLTDAEVDADLVFRLLSRFGRAPIPGQFTPAPPDELIAHLRTLVPWGGAVAASGARRVIALCGPTGVGKTTTLAKIAGQAAFRLGLSVALVSTDAYRIYGAQHLATYAALMGVPFHVAGTGADLRALLAGPLATPDLVLIDTSGRSPRDPAGIDEIQRVLAADPRLEVFLALAANARARDMALALDAFSPLPVRHLVFTKVDEATSTGAAFSLALKARRPVAYLGTGQEVPDDLEAATAAALTRSLLPEEPYGGSGR